MTSIAAAAAPARPATTMTIGTTSGEAKGSATGLNTPRTAQRTALLTVGGLIAGGLVGSLIGARSGHPIRGAMIGAGLVGSLGALVGCAPAIPLGTASGREEYSYDGGTEQYQGTCTERTTVTGPDTNGDGARDVYESTRDYPCTKERTKWIHTSGPVDGAQLQAVRGSSFGSLDTLLGASEFTSKWNSGKSLAIMRDSDKVALGSVNVADKDVYMWDPNSVQLTAPDAIAVLTHGATADVVTFGPGATENDKAAINARLHR
jgi:hypothetical protein